MASEEGEANINVDAVSETPAPPSDGPKCIVRFLLVSGNSFKVEYPPDTTIGSVKQNLLDETPKELESLLETKDKSKITRVESIRILYLGKFLEDSKTLREYDFKIHSTEITTVHIHINQNTAAKDEAAEKKVRKESSCCSVM